MLIFFNLRKNVTQDFDVQETCNLDVSITTPPIYTYISICYYQQNISEHIKQKQQMNTAKTIHEQWKTLPIWNWTMLLQRDVIDTKYLVLRIKTKVRIQWISSSSLALS